MPTSVGTPTAAAGSGSEVTPVYTFSEAVADRNRLALGLLRGGTPVNDLGAKVHVAPHHLAVALSDRCQGTIAARFEGGITKEESGQVLEKLIAE